jgi:hypothetical protein
MLQLGHLLPLSERLPQQLIGGAPIRAPHRQEAQDVLSGDPGGDAAPSVGERVLCGLHGRIPPAGGPLDMREMRSHVVPVIPQLDLLGVTDSFDEPALGAVVFHQL